MLDSVIPVTVKAPLMQRTEQVLVGVVGAAGSD